MYSYVRSSRKVVSYLVYIWRTALLYDPKTESQVPPKMHHLAFFKLLPLGPRARPQRGRHRRRKGERRRRSSPKNALEKLKFIEKFEVRGSDTETRHEKLLPGPLVPRACEICIYKHKNRRAKRALFFVLGCVNRRSDMLIHAERTITP